MKSDRRTADGSQTFKVFPTAIPLQHLACVDSSFSNMISLPFKAHSSYCPQPPLDKYVNSVTNAIIALRLGYVLHYVNLSHPFYNVNGRGRYGEPKPRAGSGHRCYVHTDMDARNAKLLEEKKLGTDRQAGSGSTMEASDGMDLAVDL